MFSIRNKKKLSLIIIKYSLLSRALVDDTKFLPLRRNFPASTVKTVTTSNNLKIFYFTFCFVALAAFPIHFPTSNKHL